MPEFVTIDIDRTEPLLDAIASAPRIGIDTEFMREKTFFAQLCLIQVALGERIHCIDPLAGEPPAGFWPALLEPTWVLHAGRQDLEVVYQAAGRLPGTVFDTQIAAALLGYPPQSGYAGLVADLFEVTLDKSHTRTDWSRRPLSTAAFHYAAEDVEHLLPAREVLCERLERRGRLEWARQDAKELLDPALYRSDVDNAVERLKGARHLRGRARRAAVGLARWRERAAEKFDKPRQWILRDALLLELAVADPTSRRDLAGIAGMPPATARRLGGELLDILKEARESTDDYEPPARPDEEQKALLKAMQQEVAGRAAELGISAEIIAPRKELSAALTGDRDVRVFRGWRRELVGDDLLHMLGD